MNAQLDSWVILTYQLVTGDMMYQRSAAYRARRAQSDGLSLGVGDNLETEGNRLGYHLGSVSKTMMKQCKGARGDACREPQLRGKLG